MKRDLRKLNRRMQRMEDKHRRDMTALRNEMMSTVALLVPTKAEPSEWDQMPMSRRWDGPSTREWQS